MIISPYFYGILKRAIRKCLGESIPKYFTQIGLSETRVNKDRCDYITYTVFWNSVDAVDAETAQAFSHTLVRASNLAHFLNQQNLAVNYLLTENRSASIEQDVQLCTQILEATNSEMLSDFLQGKNAVARYAKRMKGNLL